LPILRELAEKVSARLKRQELAGRLIVLKLRRSDFRRITRNTSLDGYTNLADRIFRTGQDLLRKELDGTEYRLLGIGVGDLGSAGLVEPADLIDIDAGKRASAERAMDEIRGRFGPHGLGLGLTFVAKPQGSDQGEGQS